jgi:glycosyltransferase involved in cell wall biosynthesis
MKTRKPGCRPARCSTGGGDTYNYVPRGTKALHLTVIRGGQGGCAPARRSFDCMIANLVNQACWRNRSKILSSAIFASKVILDSETSISEKSISETSMKTVGLCMIVKNESKVILRCLESVRPIVDYVLIEDTGSTDNTQAIIREWLHRVGLPGEVYEEPWRDFAYNRSHALARLRENRDVDYALFMDADDVLELAPGFKMPHLKADSYTVEIRHQELRYWRTQLARNALPWRYEGVLHEFLSCPVGPDNRRAFPEERSQKRLRGVRIQMSEEGARRQISANDRYRGDAAVLENALVAETDPFLISRYTFYLAQSYRDCGERDKALTNYLKRAELGFWDQEVFISLYQSAKLKADLGFDEEDVLATYLRANGVRRDRAEALHGAARFCRVTERFEQGYGFAQRALGIKAPADGLFLEHWIYDYGALDEFAVNAYWTEHYQDSLDAFQRLLTEGKMPADMYDRVKKNADQTRATLDRQTIECLPVIDDKSNLARLRLVLICGPWGSGSSAVAGMLERMGAFGVGPYFETSDPNTPNSYESHPFREILQDALGCPSQGTFSLAPSALDAVQSGLRILQRRIKRQEFGPYDLSCSKPIFLKYPLSALVIRQICEVFDTKLIYVMRPSEDIERTRLRRNWPPYYGAEGAAMIYGHMSARLKDHENLTMAIDYKQLLVSPAACARDIAQFAGLKPSAEALRRAANFIQKGGALSLVSTETRRDEPPANTSGDDAEIAFACLYHAADALRTIGRPFDEVVVAYDCASSAAPHRAEALHDASRLCRLNNKFAEAYEYARRGLALACPAQGLSIQQWIYDYGLLDELAVNAYWIERYEECLQSCQRLLSEGKMPADMYDRVKKNVDFATEKISSTSDPSLRRKLNLIGGAS